MKEYEKPLQKANARIRRIVRQINSIYRELDEKNMSKRDVPKIKKLNQRLDKVVNQRNRLMKKESPLDQDTSKPYKTRQSQRIGKSGRGGGGGGIKMPQEYAKPSLFRKN